MAAPVVAYTPDGAALVYSVGHTVERLASAKGRPEVLARVALPPDASLSLRFSLDGTGRYLLHTTAGVLPVWTPGRVDDVTAPIEGRRPPG
ncbi:hypothetical protein [Nonomuraea dietziae]|uniref:hypothetical protein n=1 Tax=Nonomuraea dietziae TaxID=65515 RepID=UPI0031E3DA4D